MWDAFGSVPEALKRWREHGDDVYQFNAGLAAVLVIISTVTYERPSELLASFMRGLGAVPVARWFSEDAPPIIAFSSEVLRAGVLWTFLGVITLMVVVPLWRGRHADNQRFAWESHALLGSRSASSVWLLLLVACQQRPFGSGDVGWMRGEPGTLLYPLLWLLGGIVVYAAAWRVGVHRALNSLLKYPAILVYRALVGLTFTVIAVILAGLSFPVSLIGWPLALEPDRLKQIREEREEARADKEEIAQGAVVLPAGGHGDLGAPAGLRRADTVARRRR